jgi:hypothetical protein
MPTRLIGWLAAVLAMLVMLALVAGELTNARQRRWWAGRPLTTDTVAGLLLVLLVTILVVNQLLNRQQARQRGHAVAAQAAIMVAQATRSAKAVSSVIDGSGDRGAASDGFRTYMMMLLIGAPVLIDDPVARRFLEQAQYLGGVMAAALAVIDRSADGAAVPGDGTGGAAVPGDGTGGAAVRGDRLADAMQQLQDTAAPLLQLLHPAIRDSIQGIGRTAEE